MLALLQEELITAMKAQDKATLTGLRNIIGKLKIRQIDKGQELTKYECIQILQSSVKQLKDSIIHYEKAGRSDLVEVETFELDLSRYQANAVVYYLKAKLAEDMMDMEAREYFLREFKRQLEKSTSALKRGPYMVQGFKEMR